MHAVQTDHNSFTYARVIDEVLEQHNLPKSLRMRMRTATSGSLDSVHDQQLGHSDTLADENENDSPFMKRGVLLEAIKEALLAHHHH